MKKILLTLMVTFLSFMCHSQTFYKSYGVVSIDSNQDIPKYLVGYTDTDRIDTIGIILTVEQAQKIDNDLELLDLYKQVHTNCDSTVKFLIQVVDDYKKMTLLAQQTFKAYELTNKDLKLQIDNLNKQVAIKEKQISTKNDIIKSKDDIIDIDKLQIKHLKQQKTGLMIGGITLGVGLIYMIMGHPGIR